MKINSLIINGITDKNKFISVRMSGVLPNVVVLHPSATNSNLTTDTNMKSVKSHKYPKGSKVYYAEGATPEFFRGEIVKCMKIAVHIKTPAGEIIKVNKRSLGIVIPPQL